MNARRLAGPVLAIARLTAACTRDPPPSTHAPDAPTATALPSASAVVPPAPSGAPVPTPSASGATPPRRAACTFDLPTPLERLARVPSGLLAKALLPSLDVATMKATIIPGDGGKPMVTDCAGHPYEAEWAGGEPSPGTVRVVARTALPDAREAVWIGTAMAIGMGAADAYGIFAIVSLDGPTLLVLGVAPWDPQREWNGKLRAEKLGGETVYVERDGFVNEIGGSVQENVWTLRGNVLHQAGVYYVLETHHPYGGDDLADDAGFYTGESFTATPRFTGREVVLKGESTWNHVLARATDGGSSWGVGRRIPWTRRFEIRDDKLVETGAPSKWGHSLAETL